MHMNRMRTNQTDFLPKKRKKSQATTANSNEKKVWLLNLD